MQKETRPERENMILAELAKAIDVGLTHTSVAEATDRGHAQTYSFLRSLEEQGLVQSRVVQARRKNLPNQVVFRITTGGLKRLDEWV